MDSNSALENSIFLTYLCTINEGKPAKDEPDNDSKHNKAGQTDDHNKVVRSKALHELIDAHADENVKIVGHYSHITNSPDIPTSSSDDGEGSECEETQFESSDNPRKLKLTKMKWLTEGREGSPDSRSPSLSLSPVTSSTCSQYSRESDTNLKNRGDKYLSTILRLDREHNLFGLSNIAIVGSRASKKTCKKEKAVFHQTAIVQICCRGGCCKYRSNTDLPAILKCGRCNGCCTSGGCSSCLSCVSCIDPPICNTSACPTCPRSSCCIKNCKTICLPTKCTVTCNNSYGFQLTLKTKPKYEPTYVELTPRSSCVLSKPMMSRTCYHFPQCLPPSSCFPYLMPCYWPARAGAPCSNPTRCFHNPPCPAPRKPRLLAYPDNTCTQKCTDAKKKTKCTSPNCLGNVPNLNQQLEAKYGGKQGKRLKMMFER